MRRILLLLMLLLLAAGSAVQAETVNRIVAVVNDDIITLYQLDQELEKRQYGNGGLAQLSPQALAEARQKALPGLIDETLIAQRVKTLGIEVDNDEIEAAISDVLMQNQLTRDELIKALDLQGMSFDVYRENLRQQILRFKLLGHEVKNKVDVTNQELLDYFREHIDDYRTKPSVHLARMTFPLPDNPTPEQVAAVRAKAEQALQALRHGQDFFSVLLAYSGDQSAQGGDMGSFDEGELSPAFEQAIKSLGEGEVSEPVETPEGIHLFKVIARQTGSIRQFDAVKGEISKILTEKKTDEAFKTWAEDLRKTAHIDIRL